jgi:hypothetical protein
MPRYLYDSRGNMTAISEASAAVPQIARQPIDQVIERGDFATFSVVVPVASGMMFQWKFNGTEIPGATGDSLVLTNVAAVDEGRYSVVVTNSLGNVESEPATLMLDADRDELPDNWEMTKFGNVTSQRSQGDPDRDDVSNLSEFLDDTNPMSATSLRPELTAYSGPGGSVTVTPMRLSYELGEIVTLTAAPLAPNVFVGWAGELDTGELVGITNPVSFPMNANKTVRARFASVVAIPSGLVAFWRAETDATDLLGAHDGTFFAGSSVIVPSVTAQGKVGGAFSFDGTVHVRVPDSAALRPAQLTVELWLVPAVLSGIHQTVIARGSSANNNDTWYLGLFNGRPRFWSHGDVLLEGPSTIPLNQWTHLAVSFDGTTKRLYVNGLQVASQTGLGALVYDPAPTVPVTIGADWASNGPAELFTGRVDEVAIYNRALTANEIADLYNADFVGKNIAAPYFTLPSPLPEVAIRADYTQQLTTTLGTAPISFSLSAGALPPGITVSPAGVISGTPTVPGTFDFTMRATDAAGRFTEQLYVLRVAQPVTPPDDLVAWWRGEPVAGSVVPDIIGGHDGGFFTGNTAAAPTYTPDGKVGTAFTFDGTRHIRVPDAVELRPPEMTVEAWVFPAVRNNASQTIIARGAGDNSDTWYLGLLNGRLRFLSHGADLLEAPSELPLNAWTHLAASFDGTTKRLYINGLQVGSKSGLGALVYDSAPVPVTIGADWANGPLELFTGRIDEPSLYRRALAPAEVVSLADAGPAGKSTVGPYISSPSQLPIVVLGQPCRHTFTSVRGTPPMTYALAAGGVVPSGLTLTPQGVLSGTPATAGSFSFVVRATDAATLVDEQRCTLAVVDRVPAPAGLIGWWKAEGDAQDAAGTNHGTLRNGAGFAAGKVGQAFSLDGTDDCIEIPDTPALRPGSVTLETWVAFEATSGLRVILAKPVGAGTSDSYGLWLDFGTLKGAVGDAAGIGPQLGAALAPAPGRWYHLAYTFDDGTDQHALYIDGVQVATGAVTKTIGYDAQPLLLGRDTENGVPNFFLKGRIDEPAIYNRALTKTEIAAIYNAGPAGKRLNII